MTFAVYEVWDVSAARPIYVGKTRNVEERRRQHLKDMKAKRNGPAFHKILRKMTAEGREVEFRAVFESESEEEVIAEEVRRIALHGRRDMGKGPLWNLTNGGEGISGHRMSPETRALFSEQRKGRTPPNKGRTYKHSVVSPKKGKPWSERQRAEYESRSAERKDLARQRMSAAHMGQQPSREQNEAHAARMTGAGNPNFGKKGYWTGKVGPNIGKPSPLRGWKKGADGKRQPPEESKRFTPNDAGLEVLTDKGWQPFSGISTQGRNPIYEVRFTEGVSVRCSGGHEFALDDGSLIRADTLSGGERVIAEGREWPLVVVSATATGETATTYSLMQVGGGSLYFTNGVLSKNCEFVTDDEVLIDALVLARLEGAEPIFYTETVRWFSEPLPNHAYLVALDPSMGTGDDYSALQVFRLPEMEQVAEWQHNRSTTRDQVKVLMQTLLYLDATLRDNRMQIGDPDIYWTVENNSLGESVLQIIEDTGEERFPGLFVCERKRKGQPRGRFRKGLNTTHQRKLAACARLKSLVESDRAVLRSGALIRELKTFVKKESSYSAKPGEHDDLVSALLLVTRMLDIVIWFGAEAGDLREHIADDELGESDPMPMTF